MNAHTPKKQGQLNYVRGKVNHVTSESAQDAPDVVIGMFPVNSHSASVLFDSGASHSFISARFVKKNTMLMHTMKKNMLVSSPGGEMKASLMCPRVKLVIRGVEFEADLMVLNFASIDVILGMDWLIAHKAVIQCATRTILL